MKSEKAPTFTYTNTQGSYSQSFKDLTQQQEESLGSDMPITTDPER